MKQFMKLLLICFAWAASLFHKRKRPAIPRRIFILASGYLGDTFWAVQSIALLKKAYPEAELFIGGRPFIRELCHSLIPEENQVVIQSVVSDRMRENVSFRKIFSESGKICKEVKPDLLIDLVCNRYSALFALRSGAYSVGADIADEFYPLYSFCAKQDLFPGVHLAFRPRSIVSQFLGLKEASALKLVPPSPLYDKKTVFEKLSIGEGEKIIMLIPGAGWEAKRWQINHFHKLAEHLSLQGCRIVVSGSGNEHKLCLKAIEGIRDALLLCDDLAETISLLPHCAAVIGNDSGVIHLAAAFGIKVFSFFCQTNPEFCGALGEDSHFFRTKCPYAPGEGEHFCCGGPSLNCKKGREINIPVEEVVTAITKPAKDLLPEYPDTSKNRGEKKQTICLFSGDITRCGGTERISILLANELVKQENCRVIFLSITEGSPATYFPLDERVERFVLYKKNILFTLYLLPIIWKLHSFIKKQKIQILIDVDVILSAVSVPARIGTECHLISWEHFHYEENLKVFLRRFAKNIAKYFSSAVVVLTNDDRKQYMDHHARVPVITIPNAITENINCFEKPVEDCFFPAGPFILSVGRLDYPKGFERIPLVAEEIFRKNPEWTWVIVGEGGMKEEIEAEIAKRKLNDKIILAGKADPYIYYKKAAFCVMTSRYEGFGLILLESLSQQCPVISFNCKCGPANVIKDGENGFLVPAEDFGALQQCIEKLINDPSLRAKLSRNARESIVDFSVENFMERWNTLLRRVGTCEKSR